MRAPWFHYVGKVLTRFLLLFTRWQVKGIDNIPSRGPVLIISNHINKADPPMLSVSIGRRVMFMAKEELFHLGVLSYFIRTFGAFPVNRGRPSMQALREANRLLADGMALAMFPEGKRSPIAQLQPAFSGSALIASHNRGVPILPVGISGTEKMKGVSWLWQHPEITIKIGVPFYLPTTDGKLTKAELAQLTTSMMEHIAELLPPEYRGFYAQKSSQNYED